MLIRHIYKGDMMRNYWLPVAIDVNNGIFLLAFAIVDEEKITIRDVFALLI